MVMLESLATISFTKSQLKTSEQMVWEYDGWMSTSPSEVSFMFFVSYTMMHRTKLNQSTFTLNIAISAILSIDSSMPLYSCILQQMIYISMCKLVHRVGWVGRYRERD